jgi:uncharacterized protein
MIVREYDSGRHTVQDPIHGAITFGPIEKAVIDHGLFQRLHGLRQNSLLYLIFPSANHTRFDHSIGVMCLAEKFLAAIIKNQEQICRTGEPRGNYQKSYRVDGVALKAAIQALSSDNYFKIVLRVAALFHDIGHGPLSHLFDEFFPSASEMTAITKEDSFSHIYARLLKFRGPDSLKPIRHEVLSCIIATRVLLDCTPIIKDFGIDPRKMARDVCSIIDNVVEPSDQLNLHHYKVESLFQDILSSDIDVDRMDYLLRDSHMCGVNYGLYDPDRILKSMCAYGCTDTKKLRVAVRYSGLGALEDLLLSRYQMHAQIYGHKTNRACNAMLAQIRTRLRRVPWKWYKGCRTIKQLLGRFLGLDDHTFIEMLRDRKVDGGVGEVKEIAEKLFLERKLYKRVYEERTACVGRKTTSAVKRWEKYRRRLTLNHVQFKEDEFENKGPKLNQSSCPLKVLRKHPQRRYYEVHGLRRFTTIVRYIPEKECTYRVYCKDKYVNKAKSLLGG